jgi:type I restriction enzyme, S subunit
MSVLDGLPARTGWERAPFGRLVTRSKASGRPDLPPLSVYLEDGVVPRSSRDDNHNRLGDDASKYLVVQPGDVVFNKLRTWQGGLGISRYQGIVSPAYYVCRPQPSVEPRFLHYLLRSRPYLAELTRVSKFMPPSQFDILWDDLREIPVVHPALVEQRAIADYLDAETARIDALIAKKMRLVKLLEARFEDQVSQVLWRAGAETIRLKHLCGVPSSGNRDHQSFIEGGAGIPCLRGLNVRPRRIQRDELLHIGQDAHARQRATHLRAGDVVIVRSGMAGAAAAIPQELDGANCVDLVIVRRSPDVIPAWLEYALNSREAQEQVVRRQAGAILTHFNAVDAGEVRLPHVERREQQNVVEILDAAKLARDALVERLDRQTALLREHRQALITAAVTGELAIPGVA